MKLDRRSPVLEKLAELYAASTAGTTGTGNGYLIRFDKLLAQADCTSGERYENALADLRAHDGQAVRIQYFRDKPSNHPTHVRVPLAFEATLFDLIGRVSPTAERAAWAALFVEASRWTVPDLRKQTWLEFCQARAEQMRTGASWKPFRQKRLERAEKQLKLLPGLLSWNRKCLLRTASGQLDVDSKFLEKSAGPLQQLLCEASGGAVRSFEDLGIEYNPTTVRFHGPVRIRLHGLETNYVRHRETALSETNVKQLAALHFDAPRCVTVENLTKFHELCDLESGDIFVSTSYPNKATVDFLKRLPVEMPLYHFGDTDPWGFDVLRTLRRALDRPVLPLHMRYRPKPGSPELSDRDRRKLTRLLDEPLLADVREELRHLDAAGCKGDFEQETLLLTQQEFPYMS